MLTPTENKTPGPPGVAGRASRDAVRCPSCGETDTRPIDKIPPAYEFAGRELDRPLPGGMFHGCLVCGLYFRHPRLSKHELDALYEAGSSENWQTAPSERADWRIAAQLIHSQDNIKSVLDVGCFDGRFLEYLGGGINWAGIEIHPQAAEAATRRGISILGRNFAVLDGLSDRFDCVTAIDVIEHVEDPMALLASMARVIRPKGVIIVSTGNTSAWSWRMMGGMYWYCTNPEHIAFINPAWCRKAAARLGLDVIDEEEFSHEPLSLSGAFAHGAANLLYRCAPILGLRLRRLYAAVRGKPPESWYVLPPPWRCAKDHFITVFRSRGASA